jgi:3-oxoacyl-[acyl-carrier protein] reductase
MKNTVAIVSGVSQGIGRSTALRLAQDFSSLVLAARNGDAPQSLPWLVPSPSEASRMLKSQILNPKINLTPRL